MRVRLANMRCFIPSCFIVCSVRYIVLKLWLPMGVDSELTFISLHTTRHLEKTFLSSSLHMNAHEYLVIIMNQQP